MLETITFPEILCEVRDGKATHSLVVRVLGYEETDGSTRDERRLRANVFTPAPLRVNGKTVSGHVTFEHYTAVGDRPSEWRQGYAYLRDQDRGAITANAHEKMIGYMRQALAYVKPEHVRAAEAVRLQECAFRNWEKARRLVEEAAQEHARAVEVMGELAALRGGARLYAIEISGNRNNRKHYTYSRAAAENYARAQHVSQYERNEGRAWTVVEVEGV